MEEVLASMTCLVRHLLVGGYERVANCAFGLALQCTDYVLAEYRQTISY